MTMYGARMHWASYEREDRNQGGRELSHQDLHRGHIPFYSFFMKHTLRGVSWAEVDLSGTTIVSVYGNNGAAVPNY